MSMISPVETPELDKLSRVTEQLGTQRITDFLEWFAEHKKGRLAVLREETGSVPCLQAGRRRGVLALEEGKLVKDQDGVMCCAECRAPLYSDRDWTHYPLSEWQPEGYFPIDVPIETLLAEYAGVDMKKVEQERQALISYLRDHSPSRRP